MIWLVHWDSLEARDRLRQIEKAGYNVGYQTLPIPELIKKIRRSRPEAVVIDLTRLPSQGRDLAAALQTYLPMRKVPFIFAGGEQEKVASVRLVFPHAVYSDWSKVGASLKKAIKHPPHTATSHKVTAFEAYKHVPLERKLGVSENTTTLLIGAPDNFESKLGPLPPTAVVTSKKIDRCDTLIWFVHDQRELNRTPSMVMHTRRLWIAWPKKSGKIVSDLSETIVREAGLSAGLVDYKICSIDQSWSALLFSRRSAK